MQIEDAAPAFLGEIFEDINEGDLYDVVKSLANDGLISLHGPAGREVVEMTEVGHATVRAVRETESGGVRPRSSGASKRPTSDTKVHEGMEAFKEARELEKANHQRRARELASDKSGLFHGRVAGRDEIIRILTQISNRGSLYQSEIKSQISLERIDRLLHTLIRLGVVASDHNSTIPMLSITEFGEVFLKALEGIDDIAPPLDD